MAEIVGIKYIGPCLDSSGYAKANRGNILALHNAGIPITVSPISFEDIRPDFGEEGEVLNTLIGKDIDYNIVIVHTTPEFWSKFMEEEKINIGYTIWETSELHPDWPKYINKTADKVLVGCSWNKDVFKDSGVTIPIGVVPHGINMSVFDKIEPYNIKGVGKDTFVFYDIFQFVERKHPVALLKAYWHAFQNNENVALVMKTYRSNYSEPEKQAIRDTIKRVKDGMPMKNPHAKVLFISDMLTEDEIHGLHARGDCYVSLDRGEGWGLSPFTSWACGNPIIVTGYGGVTDYAKPENSYLVDYSLTPVFGMSWSPWYTGKMLWAEPNLKHSSDLMKHVYYNNEEAKYKGKLLKEYIKNNFTLEHIASRIIYEIEII